jgi:hypothetical protein
MGGLEEDRRVEALRLLKLAGDRLDAAYIQMIKFAPTRSEAKPVKDAALVCAGCITDLRVPNSDVHWTVASSLRTSVKTIEGISEPRVRAAWQDMTNAEAICQEGQRAQ